MRVGIVGQQHNRRAVSLVDAIAARLERAGVDVAVDESTHEAFQSEGSESWASTPEGIPVEGLSACDLAISVGGDGTFLYAARGADTTPIMGVNLGEVGFLNAVSPDAAVETAVEEVRQIRETGSPRTRELPRLRAETEAWTLPPALNEVVVQGEQRGHGNAVEVTVLVGDSEYITASGDGVLVATTTGSTAYNLSEGGPLVHPDVPGWVITGMCLDESQPPLVVDTEKTVTVCVEADGGATAVGDGRLKRPIDPPAEVRLRRADESVYIAGPPLDFFAALEKLE